jgi:LacI family transcriptional regulator
MITETSDVSTARDRLRGYRDALEAAGIPFLPELIVETSTVDPRLARQATLDLLDHVEPPSALFAVNNIAVIGVAEAARERSLEIPRDIALACFDDIDYASRFHPFLTAMVQPAETFGTIATQLLLDRLAGRVHERRRVVVLPADLIVRESCGAQLPVS